MYWLVGTMITVFMFTLTEGSLIVTTKLFGVTKATLLNASFTIPLSWLVIYLSTKSKRSFRFGKWLDEKKAGLSKRAKLAMEGGKWIAIFNTTIFLGPIITSILMLMIGFNTQRVYFYSVVSALLCAWVWCAFYSGLLHQLARLFI